MSTSRWLIIIYLSILKIFFLCNLIILPTVSNFHHPSNILYFNPNVRQIHSFIDKRNTNWIILFTINKKFLRLIPSNFILLLKLQDAVRLFFFFFLKYEKCKKYKTTIRIYILSFFYPVCSNNCMCQFLFLSTWKVEGTKKIVLL